MKPSLAVLLLAAGAVAAAETIPAQPDLSGCLRELRTEAARNGVGTSTFDQYTKDATYDAKRALPDEAQAEFVWPVREYLGVLVDQQRVEDGRRLLREQAPALAVIEARYGVDPATVVAIFGVETNFGAVKPRYPVIETFVNRSCGFPGARPAFRQEQKANLFQALKMLQSGEVREDDFLGSRAGAFGMTQFMPLTYARDKADVDGDGQADIIHSVPDALGASARFLVRHGWTRGLPWAIAVQLPAGFDTALASAGSEHVRIARALGGKVRTLAQWRELGVRTPGGRVSALPDTTPMTLLLPEATPAPALLVTRNFVAFWRYNNSEAYALAVGLLGDELRGVPRVIAWAADETPLSRKAVAELQSLLIRLGHDDLTVDGVPGTATRRAVRAEQQRLGRPETGFIGVDLLQALRASVK